MVLPDKNHLSPREFETKAANLPPKTFVFLYGKPGAAQRGKPPRKIAPRQVSRGVALLSAKEMPSPLVVQLFQEAPQVRFVVRGRTQFFGRWDAWGVRGF